VFPVIFATLDVNIFSGKQKDSLFYAFAGGCLALSVGLLTSAGLGYFSSRDSMLFYYTWLSFPWHPSYLTMHLVFALSFLLIKLVSNRDQLSRSMTWIHWLLAICFFIVIILLSSKAGIITLGLVLMVLILYLAFYLRKYVRAIGLFILTFFAFWASFTLFPYSVQRFQSAKGTLSNWDQIEPGNTESTAERILIWDAALELGMGHCVFGVGIGDARDELSDIYFKKEIWQAHKLKLNAHNQYLQTFISTGFFGLLVLLGTMLLPAGFAIRNKHYFYFLFILITGFNFIFESMLCRQAGIVFFAYFNALLWYFFVLEKTSSGN